METRYTVRQAVEMTGIKSYVLRYWEEELNLRIQRNEMGHRYYTGYDIQLFLNIKELKNRGLKLQAIRDLIPQISRTVPGSYGSKVRLLEGEKESGNNEELREESNKTEGNLTEESNQEEIKDGHSEKILEFQSILERLILQELQYQSEDEEKCRSLDLAIRRQQMVRKEAAAALAEKKTNKKRRNL